MSSGIRTIGRIVPYGQMETSVVHLPRIPAAMFTMHSARHVLASSPFKSSNVGSGITTGLYLAL